MATIELPTTFEAPGRPGSLVECRGRYENYIGGSWVAPAGGEYRENRAPATGEAFCEVPRSRAADVELALRAAESAERAWSRTARVERSHVLSAIADAIEAHGDMLAVAESWDTGKPVRQTLDGDVPLAVDHFRYFADVIRTEDGLSSTIDANTVAYQFQEPLGVVAQLLPFNFPLVMGAWKVAAALAAGDCTIVKPASPTPWSILKLVEVIGPLVPPGVLGVVNGPAEEIAPALGSSGRIAKLSISDDTLAEELREGTIAGSRAPSSTELGGKSPNVFFADVLDEDDAFLEKAVEGLLLFTFNKGEVCTSPSRALIEESIYEEFLGRCLKRLALLRQGDPLDRATQLGAQVSEAQLQKIERYVGIGLEDGAELLAGGRRARLAGELAGGWYFEPTVFKGSNDMRIFQEEIFGPVLAVTSFKDEREALEIANDTPYALGAGVWTRDGARAFRMSRDLRATRVWTNCYHLFPAHSAFGGYEVVGVGRENHRAMLERYSQTKCVLVSHDRNPVGLF